MYIYERMNKNPNFVRMNDKISDVLKFISTSEENVCVIDDDGVFMGIIDNDAINYLPKNTRVIDVTKTGTFKINQSRLIEEGAFILKENRLDFLPVVDNNELLVGTVTKTALFSTFMKMLSINGEGIRLVLSAVDNRDFIPVIAEKARNTDCRIDSISSYGNNGNEIIVSYRADKKKSSAFEEEIKNVDGLKIKSIKHFS